MTMCHPSRSAKRHHLVHLLAGLLAASTIIARIIVVSLKLKLTQNDIWNSLVSTAVVVGNYLWIHGGELTTWNCMGDGGGSDYAMGNVTTVPSMSITP